MSKPPVKKGHKWVVYLSSIGEVEFDKEMDAWKAWRMYLKYS